MSHNKKFDSFSEREDTVPIGSLNILSAKYEVSYKLYIINGIERIFFQNCS